MKQLLFFFSTFLFSLSLSPQYQRVRIVTGAQTKDVSEPSIAIDPTNPSRILAGTVLRGWHLSVDSGKTWTNGELSSAYGVWGDPCILADNEGLFYYLHLSDPSGKNWLGPDFLDRIVCQTSTDGKTWSSGSYMGLNSPKQQDKEWAVVANTGAIYCTWTQFDKYGSKSPEHESHIYFSKSVDKGESWSQAKSINTLAGDCLDGDQTSEGAVPAAGLNDDVYVCWSRDNKLWFNYSKDGGEHWLDEEYSIQEHVGGWEQSVDKFSRINGMPITVIDNSSGPFRGTLYVMWSDERNGKDNLDIFTMRSFDKGKTWSKPIQVNDDTNPNAHQFLPWICVDQSTGYLYSVFYDRRHGAQAGTHVYLAWSKDGGSTWVNERLTTEAFESDPKVFIGDYNNISAVNGIVRPIWIEFKDGKKSAYTSIINFVK